jgi:hypothetical protein
MQSFVSLQEFLREKIFWTIVREYCSGQLLRLAIEVTPSEVRREPFMAWDVFVYL